MKIEGVKKEEFRVLVDLWERSVRATHYFLKEADIDFFKPLILNKYLDLVDLFCVKDSRGVINAFAGVYEDSLEMLFVDPSAMRKGIGRQLLDHAIEKWGIRKVDVNEDNSNALEFYEAMGFYVVGRSPLDGSGKPYPLLHMELTVK